MQVSLTTSISRRERVILLTAVWLTCVVFLCGLTIADPDLWGHTLYGLRALDQGVLTERADPFSYTAPGATWINHEWLTELQYGWLWRQYGNAGLVMWRNGLVLALFLIALVELKRQRAGLAASVLLLVFSTECLANFVVFVRPQIATYVFFAAFLLILSRWWDEPQRRAIWCLPALMIAWVNMHGGFLAGCGIVGLFCTCAAVRAFRDRARDPRRARQTMLVAAALPCLVAAATFVNPYGAGLHAMLLEHLGTRQFVREWQPLWGMQQSPVFYVPFLLLALAIVGRRRMRTIDVIVLVVVGWQAVSHVRHVALLGITALILLPAAVTAAIDRLFPQLIAAWSSGARRGVRWGGVALVVAVLAGLQIRGSLPFWRTGLAPWDIAVEGHSNVPGMPVRAVQAIRNAGLRGNLVTDYGWGQFVIWHLHPGSRVAFDGRYRTVYRSDLEQEFLTFQTATLSSDPVTPLIDDYPTQLALLPVDTLPDQYLIDRPDWVCLYRDDQAAVHAARAALSGRTESLLLTGRLASPGPQLRWTSFPGGPASGTEIAFTDRDDRGPDERSVVFGRRADPGRIP